MRRVFLVLATLALAVVLSGCGGGDDAGTAQTAGTVQTTTTSSDAAIDRVVNVEGERGLYLRCSGTGSPTVVMEGGDEDTSASYAFAESRLAAVTRTCVYDRANLGRSDVEPRSLQRCLKPAGPSSGASVTIQPMGEAFLWGVVGGSSLVIGGAIARRVSLTARHVGLIMAFGAGVLISAVAYELVHEAFETSAGDGGIAVGLLAGSALFFGAEVLIERLAARRPTEAGPAQAGRALVLGIVLDGIPESLVLGLTVLEAGTVSVAFLVAVFVANLPEAIAATAALERAGRDPQRIMRFWVLVALGFGLASLLGYVALDAASPRTVAIVLAFAAGAVLTMLANTMMPEALHHGGKLAGFITTVGFAVAFGISALQ